MANETTNCTKRPRAWSRTPMWWRAGTLSIWSSLRSAIRHLPALALFAAQPVPGIPSADWSGYEAHVSVRSVQATWTLPRTAATDNFPTWVGIGGDSACDTLIQAGTTYNPNFRHYTVWWEYVRRNDAGPVNISGLILTPGSSVTIGIAYRSGRSTFSILDRRTGRRRTVRATTPNACQNPADFVVERLDRPVRFGTVSFVGCTVNGLPLEDYHPTRVVMSGTRVSSIRKSRFSVSSG